MLIIPGAVAKPIGTAGSEDGGGMKDVIYTPYAGLYTLVRAAE